MRLGYWIIVVALLVGPLSSHAVGKNPSPCFVELIRTPHGNVKANGIYITGDKKYPLAVVLRNLELETTEQRALLRGRSVLSIGEGISSLVPFLREKDIYATGLDLWYDRPELIPGSDYGLKMKAYLASWGDYLQGGTALDLPYPPDTFDMVVSHLLVNNFDTQKDRLKSLDEAIRVTAPGGEVRFLGLDVDELNWWKEVLLIRYKNQISYEWDSKITPDGSKRDGYRVDILIKIKKLSSEHSPLQW